MAQVAFSHQFSHRWTNAPLEIKNALIQEFDDIVCLLDEETDLETFEFTTPNLSEYIDSVYEQIDKEHQAKLEAELATQQLSKDGLEKDRIEKDSLVDESLSDDSHNLDTISALESEQTETIETPDTSKNNQDVIDNASQHALNFSDRSHPAHNDNNSNIENSHHSDLESDISSDINDTKHDVPNSVDLDETDATTSDAYDTTTKDVTAKELTSADNFKSNLKSNIDLSNIELDESFIKELENRIDDYLTDQMALISDDLKSWLREQISEKVNNTKN